MQYSLDSNICFFFCCSVLSQSLQESGTSARSTPSIIQSLINNLYQDHARPWYTTHKGFSYLVIAPSFRQSLVILSTSVWVFGVEMRSSDVFWIFIDSIIGTVLQRVPGNHIMMQLPATMASSPTRTGPKCITEVDNLSKSIQTCIFRGSAKIISHKVMHLCAEM